MDFKFIYLFIHRFNQYLNISGEQMYRNPSKLFEIKQLLAEYHDEPKDVHLVFLYWFDKCHNHS